MLIKHVYSGLRAAHAAVGSAWAKEQPSQQLIDFSTYLAQRAILAPTNKAAADINTKVLPSITHACLLPHCPCYQFKCQHLQVLGLIPGDNHVFRSSDSVRDETNMLAFPS